MLGADYNHSHKTYTHLSIVIRSRTKIFRGPQVYWLMVWLSGAFLDTVLSNFVWIKSKVRFCGVMNYWCTTLSLDYFFRQCKCDVLNRDSCEGFADIEHISTLCKSISDSLSALHFVFAFAWRINWPLVSIKLYCYLSVLQWQSSLYYNSVTQTKPLFVLFHLCVKYLIAPPTLLAIVTRPLICAAALVMVEETGADCRVLTRWTFTLVDTSTIWKEDCNESDGVCVTVT